jgi:hypothetical protein
MATRMNFKPRRDQRRKEAIARNITSLSDGSGKARGWERLSSNSIKHKLGIKETDTAYDIQIFNFKGGAK